MWFLSYAPDSMADVRCLPLTSHFHIFIAPSLDVHAFADVTFTPHSTLLFFTQAVGTTMTAGTGEAEAGMVAAAEAGRVTSRVGLEAELEFFFLVHQFVP